MGADRRVLVVTDDAAGQDAWTAWLEMAGYDTDVCVGPGATMDCPRLHGVRCVRRERADVAVVDLCSDEDADLCTTVPDDGGTIFVRSDTPYVGDRGALLRAVDDAIRHVDALEGTPVLERSVPAVDL